MSTSMLIGSILIVLVLCIDSFIISIAYGSGGVEIPFFTTVLIALIGSSFLFIATSTGSYIKDLISVELLSKLTFIILFSMGLFKLVESLFKSFVARLDKNGKKLDFKISNVKFSLDVVCDKEILKRGTTLTFKEAVALGVALSIDSLIVGLGIGMIEINYYFLTIFSLFVSILFMNLGFAIGKKLSIKSDYEVGWLNGIMLMTMAISKIIKL